MASAKLKPVYVFLGGVSHTPEFFDSTNKEMEQRGYTATAVAYPTCGDKIEGMSQQDEVVAIQQAVTNIVDNQNRDVVLVLHSYGGIPGSRAVKGLDKETRLQNGKQTGVIEVVFCAAFCIPENALWKDYKYLPPWLDVENDCRRPNQQACALLLSDLDAEAQQYWLSKFRWQQNDLVTEIISDTPWHLSVPKTYIIFTDDKTATPAFQLKMLDSVINNTWAVKSLTSGHEPFLNRPAAFVDVVLQPTVR